MGSCYSCNSNQRGHAYTTVDMANTNSDNKLVDPLKNRASPYTRGSTTSFGFSKKRIPTTLKSLSQDRTSEMVTNYETKIASINANVERGSSRISPQHNKYSHIPRFGFKPANSTNSLGSSEELDSSNSSLNNLDPNSNNITEKCNKLLVNGLKTKFTETPKKNNNQQIVKTCNQDTSPEMRRPQSSKGFTQTKEPTATNRPKSGGSRIVTYNSGLKQPKKMITQTSSKSLIHRIVGEESDGSKKKTNNFDIEKAPLARFDDVEAMNISSVMLPDEEIFDLGSGTNERDNKKQGDNETLVEINELSSDNLSGFAGIAKQKKIIGMNASIQKKEAGKSSSRTSPKLNFVQKKISEKNDTQTVDLIRQITSRFHQEDDFADVKQEKTSTNEIMKNVTKESRRTSGDLNEKEWSLVMQSLTESISSPVDMDALSPPSEKDTFLIDDEICDQPQLIQCQSPDLSSFLCSQDLFGVDQDVFVEDGGKECMAFRSGSLDTLSSSPSSIGSNDLMLDFDQGEENTSVRNLSRRLSCEECEQNASENMKSKEHCRHRSKSLRTQYDSSKLPLIDEWNSLLDTHSNDGASAQSRTRRLRSATTSDMPTNAETRVLRPPRKMSAIEMEDGGVVIEPSSFRLLSQDVTNLKTMLLKLKRVLQEAETLNPFECHSVWKNGLYHSLAHSDPPNGVHNQEETSQENIDLRRQVVFLQQQLDEKDRTILLLQQQMTKYTISKPVSLTLSNVTNAATQTEKPRLSLTSMSQTLEESSFGSTVSCKNKSRPKIPVKPKHLTRQTNVTRSLNALPTVGQLANNSTDQKLRNSSFSSIGRSASTGDLAKKSAAKADKKVNVQDSEGRNVSTNLPKIDAVAVRKDSRHRSQIVAPIIGQKDVKKSERGKNIIGN